MPEGPFQLIETMRWQAETGYWLFDRHLARLEASAAQLGFACDGAAVRTELGALAARLGEGAHRVRLLLAADGGIFLGYAEIDSAALPPTLKLAWATRPVDSEDPLLRHKTTRRDLYDSELAAAKGKADEVLFVNQRGEVTEGSWTNLFVEIDGRLYTPPVASGLLPGTFRQLQLDDPVAGVVEALLTPDEVRQADRLFLANSVRGLMPALLLRPLARTAGEGGARPAGSGG